MRSLDDSFLVSVYSQISKRSHVIVEIVRNFLIYTFYLKNQKIVLKKYFCGGQQNYFDFAIEKERKKKIKNLVRFHF